MQDKIAKRDKQAELVRQGDLLTKFHTWVKTVRGWQLAAMAATISGIGGLQDVLAPFLAFLDVGLGPVDEMVVGAPPVIIILEAIRRISAHYGREFDGVRWLRDQASHMPTWALVMAVTGMVGVTTGLDLSIYIPIIGQTVAWPVEFLDSLVIGLPTLIAGLELRSRMKVHAAESKEIEGPTSHAGE